MNCRTISKCIRIAADEPDRAGNTGICLSIVHSREIGKLKQIERIAQAPFHKMEIPSGKDVCRKQFFHFMEKLLQADISHGDYETYVPMLAEKFADISKEEVLKRVAANGVRPVPEIL